MVRVLIVDDQISFQAILSQVLSLAGFCVVGCALDIRGAEVLLRLVHPDLAVVDFILPGLNGLDGIPCLLALQPGLPVILVSAYLDETGSLNRAAVENGAVAFFSKDDLDINLVKTWNQFV